MTNYNTGDGQYCIGCINYSDIIHKCKLEHDIDFENGCFKCGIPFPKCIYTDKKCNDYKKDPNYWEKDIYG